MKSKRMKTCLFLGLLLLVVSNCAAQKLKRIALPSVGAIKDVNAVSKNIPADCGNYYLFLKGRGLSDEYIFIAGSEGLDASMNLNGRDTRLTLLKTTIWYRALGRAFRHDYRAGDLRVTFSFDPIREYVVPYPTKIVLRKGHVVRTLRVFGYPQCD